MPPTSAHLTAANGSSSPPGRPGERPLLKTPTSNLGTNGGSQHPDKRKQGGHGPNLADEVEHLLLPTPKASDGIKGSPNQRHGNGDLTLPSAAASLLSARRPNRTRASDQGFRRPSSAEVLPLWSDPETERPASGGDRTPPPSPAGRRSPARRPARPMTWAA
ncbi:hypothetical protein [Streptomyces tailanensis]|uniref:hypothetical protein n=1 Tax=Streptomyces tailanensis TaxID=2569858 RepID=UPI001FE88850|nr:hypothetical protein [Streptomyces tailanensis]